jgi:hypothetical protein
MIVAFLAISRGEHDSRFSPISRCKFRIKSARIRIGNIRYPQSSVLAG